MFTQSQIDLVKNKLDESSDPSLLEIIRSTRLYTQLITQSALDKDSAGYLLSLLSSSWPSKWDAEREALTALANGVIAA